VRIHIGSSNDPVQVVVAIYVGVAGKPQLFLPAIEKGNPEKVANRDAIRLLVVKGLVDSVQLLEATGRTIG
jgi:hypothetical protein